MIDYKYLEDKIKDSYENGVTVEAAERLAGEFLVAQMSLAEDLRKADLNSRMHKAGVKSIKAAVYMDAATKTEKKPSDTLLDNLVNLNEIVQKEQQSFDEAEAEHDYLRNIYGILREAHIHFRSIAKGAFNG